MVAAARLTPALLALALLAGCASPSHWADDDTTYTVRRGDTVYSIAFKRGIDWRDLARWNNVRGPRYLIQVGDTLKLTGPAGRAASKRADAGASPSRAPAKPPPIEAGNAVSFRWPAQGAASRDSNGIRIAGRVGADISAAATGRVVYTGSGLIGYGKLIIVKHNNQLLSAYAHNDEILVREGDEVRAGQRIATMGEGPARKPMLHFEIRIDGQAVDPLQYLPLR